VNVTVWRDGASRSFSATLAEAPASTAEEVESGPLGLSLQTLTPPLAESLGLSRDIQGVVISEVLPGSPGAAAGLSPGEVIVEIDRKPVTSAEQAASALRGERRGGHLLRLRGPAGSRFVSIGN
jgi:serine protease Do